jgi:hypothetical protein
LQDSKLYILDYFTDGFVKAKAGNFIIKGEISGKLSDIKNSGRLTIADGVVDFLEYFSRFKDLTVDIEWIQNHIVINEFSAKSGSGQANISGKAAINNFDIEDMDIRFFTSQKGIPLTVPLLPISTKLFKDISKGEPVIDVSLTGTLEKPKIAGKIILENTRFNFDPQESNESPSGFLQAAQFNIDILSAKNTRFENGNVNIFINGAVNISGIYPNIKVNGTIESQSGTLDYLGINFDITSGKLEIVDNNLFITGEADTLVFNDSLGANETMRMTIERSNLDTLNMKFSSKDDPTLDSRTVYAKIAGIPSDETTGSDVVVEKNVSDRALRQRAVRLFDSNFTTPFARTVLRKIGIIDNLRVSYVKPESQKTASAISSDEAQTNVAANADAAATNNTLASLLYGTKYSFEKNITNQMMVGYSIIFDQTNNTGTLPDTAVSEEINLRHEIEMRYRLTNNLFIQGTYEIEGGQNALYQPDRRVMLQQQFRFGGKR